MNKKGLIFDISRFCLNDGPGIRTTVFLKGCPLNCIWCHNPESHKSVPEILYSSKRCTSCGICSEICPFGCHTVTSGEHIFTREKCTGCGMCSESCPSGALRTAGRYCLPEEIIEEVLRDKLYYDKSGGGLTVSGGEPMMQINFLEALLALAVKEGIHTCIETSGHAEGQAFERIAPLTDCFLYDWKESDPQKHRSFTGDDNKLISDNIELLDKLGKNIVLRLPLIPGYNDTSEHIEGICRAANRYPGISRMEIMPYHPLGVSKSHELGKTAAPELSVPDKEILDTFLSEIRKRTNKPIEISE